MESMKPAPTTTQAGIGFLPMTAVNFVVAMGIPRLVGRMPGSVPLLAGVLLTLTGMVWLSRAGVDSGYWTGVALPAKGVLTCPPTNRTISLP